MIRRLSIRLLERLYAKTLEKGNQIKHKIEEYKKRAAELGQIPDEKKIDAYLKQPGMHIWLSEDCAGYKRGRKIDERDIVNIKQKGYETVWISDLPVKDYEDEDGKKAEVLALKNKLLHKLSDLYNPIDETDAGKQRKGSKIDLLDGDDLLSIKIDSLQKEGAARLSKQVFGDMGSRLEEIKKYIDKIYELGLSSITLNDNRTLGNSLLLQEDGKHVRKEVSNYLINHAVNVGIYFIISMRTLQKARIQHGAQSSSARYTAGQKFKQEYRVMYSQAVARSACLGSFIYDIGFNHSELKSILDKELKELINSNGEAIHRGFTIVNSEEYYKLKKHVNVGSHLIQNLGIDTTSIITNMIRTHHCYLNGEGYPKRKGQDFQIVVSSPGSEKKTLKVHRYNFAIHELTNLLSIIDTYDAMINRRPWRLPFARYDAIEYLIENSCYGYNPETGNIDKQGIFSFAGHEKREKKFDRMLVNVFLSSIRPYSIAEILPLRDLSTNKKISEAVVVKYTKIPHRPIVRIKLMDKVVDLDLSEEKNKKYYLGEYIVTTRRHKNDVKAEQEKSMNYSLNK